jgi:hypothetical protein
MALLLNGLLAAYSAYGVGRLLTDVEGLDLLVAIVLLAFLASTSALAALLWPSRAGND